MSTGDRTMILARFRYRHEAELAKGFLEDAGIPSIVSADDAGGMGIGFNITRAAVLLVREADAAEATKILEDCGVIEGE